MCLFPSKWACCPPPHVVNVTAIPKVQRPPIFWKDHSFRGWEAKPNLKMESPPICGGACLLQRTHALHAQSKHDSNSAITVLHENDGQENVDLFSSLYSKISSTSIIYILYLTICLTTCLTILTQYHIAPWFVKVSVLSRRGPTPQWLTYVIVRLAPVSSDLRRSLCISLPATCQCLVPNKSCV